MIPSCKTPSKGASSEKNSKAPEKEGFKGFYLESSDDETEFMYNKREEDKPGYKKTSKNAEAASFKDPISDSSFSLFDSTSKLDDDSLSFNKIVNDVLVESENNKSVIDKMSEYKQAEDNLSTKTNKSTLSSSSSSSSISSTGSSCSSSSSSTVSSRSVNKDNKKTEDPLAFNISDDENEPENNETIEQEDLVDVNEIQLSQNNNQLNFSDEVMDTSSEKEEEEVTKEKQKEKELELENKKKEELVRLENEKKVDKLVDEVCQKQHEALIDELIAQTVVESFMIEFIRDKLINEEISSTSKLLRGICSNVIEEEKAELKRQEKLFKQEIKTKVEAEILEKIVNDTVDSLMKECGERVIWESKNERVTDIYESILDEVVKKMIDKSFIDFVFDEMIIENKPLINKLPPYVRKSPPRATNLEADKKMAAKQYGKRRLETVDSQPTSSQPSAFVREASASRYESPAKKICTHLEPKLKKSSPDRDERHLEKQTSDSATASLGQIKDCTKFLFIF